MRVFGLKQAEPTSEDRAAAARLHAVAARYKAESWLDPPDSAPSGEEPEASAKAEEPEAEE